MLFVIELPWHSLACRVQPVSSHLAEARNPSSALLSRIRDAKNGSRGPGSVKGSAKTHQKILQKQRNTNTADSSPVFQSPCTYWLVMTGAAAPAATGGPVLGRKHIGHEREVTIDCCSCM